MICYLYIHLFLFQNNFDHKLNNLVLYCNIHREQNYLFQYMMDLNDILN